MKKIAKKSAIFMLFVLITPACSPAKMIPTEVSTGLQNSSPEKTYSVTIPAQDSSPEIPTQTILSEEIKSEIAAGNPNNTDVSIQVESDFNTLQENFVQLYKQASSGVVSVMADDLDGFTISSGFFVDDQGHIVTSYHGVKTESGLIITTSSGEQIPANLIGKDADSDIAVLKVELPPERLFPLPLGDSDEVRVGQIVSAIGNPFGLESSMTTGIVSGIGQGFRYFRDMLGGKGVFPSEIILTDTAINPGNSGGPLINLNGEVIGINNHVVTSGNGRQNSGIAFALPIDLAKPVIEALIQKGVYQYPHMGLSSVDELSSREREALGLSDLSGIYITEVEPGGPAEQAGMIAGSIESNIPGLLIGGDLITAVDGHEVDRYDQLYAYLIKHTIPDETVILTVMREGEQMEFEVQIDSRPESKNEGW